MIALRPQVGVLACALALAACNQTRAPSLAPPGGAAPAALGAPGGSGCSGEIARFRAVIDSDAQTGNLGSSVAKRMTGEVDRASATCLAGRDADALRELNAAKVRFGYR